MLKISDFSKLSRISIRMLRYYDEKNILKPLIIKENGYRYYDPKQLKTASHINYLRYLGFRTEEIRKLLSIYRKPEEMIQYLSIQKETLIRERKQLDEKISALTCTVQKLKQEEVMMNYQVEIKTIESKDVMTRRAIIPSYDKEGLLWKGLFNELAECQMDVQIVENGMTAAVFYDEGYKEKEVDVEIMIEVKGNYQDTENIHFKKFPATKVASVTFNGSYTHITDVSYHIAQWISDHGCEITGPDFSIYHIGHLQTQNPDEFVTEICYPIR